MAEDTEQDSEDEICAAVVFFFVGLAVPVLFLGMAGGSDFVSFLAVFGVFAACIVFCEYYLTLTSGVAFGVGLVMTSLASFDWWFTGLAIAASLINIGRCAASSPQGLRLDAEGDVLEPTSENHLA